MHRIARFACSASLTLTLGACGDFLSGPGLTQDPNSPSQASIAQLFVAMQAAQFTLQEGQLARDASMFTQQMAGIGGQQLAYGSSYTITEKDVDQWSAFYLGGGLVDLRKIQLAARSAGDARWEGIADIWEALSIGTAASIWGDIPYREAAAGATAPKLDPQQQVYGDVSALLDRGIALLAGQGAGPGSYDLVYAGDVTRWRKAAYTLKARFLLHTAERLGQPAYQAALAAAQQGIDEPPPTVSAAVEGQGPGDFRTHHDNTQSSANIWAQFVLAKTDIAAGQSLVGLLVGRGNDPRLAGYFDPVAGTGPAVYRGANEVGQPVGGPPSGLGATRRSFTFRQPLVTWSENQLILAESKFRLADAAGALANLNAVRLAVGLAALPAPVTLDQIITEKYVVQFQNVDAWSDYKRTCIPALRPGGPPGSSIPGRLPYPVSERQTNPNIPAPSAAPARNWDDPNPCPAS